MRRVCRAVLSAVVLVTTRARNSTVALLSAVLLFAVTSVAVAVAMPTALIAAPCWRPPVAGQVIDHFREPACPYCAGKRGIEVRPVGDAVSVRSVETGLVTFSGNVAGVIYVVIEHADGWKVTYGRLGRSHVDRGQHVARGARVGTTDGDVYFGLRVNGEYRDPEPLLGRLAGRPRLVPLDGTARRARPEPIWSCGE